MMMLVHTVKRKKGQREEEKKGAETDAKLTISNISYQKEKELTDDRVSEMCDCCCCLSYRSVHLHMYARIMVSLYSISHFFYLLTLWKVNFVNSKDYVIDTFSAFASMFYQGKKSKSI